MSYIRQGQAHLGWELSRVNGFVREVTRLDVREIPQLYPYIVRDFENLERAHLRQKAVDHLRHNGLGKLADLLVRHINSNSNLHHLRDWGHSSLR